MQRLYEACKQIPICLSSIKQLLRTNNYSPDQLFNVMLRFVDEDCFLETQMLLDLQGTPPQRQELHCGYLGELMKMFLQHGLTLNKVVGGQSLLSELFYVDYEYTAANTARLLLENGANPNMLLDGETIFDAINFDIAFGHRNMRIFNERVHFWFVLIGYGGRPSNGAPPVHMADGCSYKLLRQHEKYDFSIQRSKAESGQSILHIFDRETHEEIAWL